MKKSHKKKYSGVFRDGNAGQQAKIRFRNRRAELMKCESKLMVITGVPYGPGQETGWAYAHCPTYQEPSIMYLTGVNQNKVILLLDPNSKESDEILFVGEKDPNLEFWDGFRFGVGNSKSVNEIKQVTGIADVRDIDDFEHVLKSRYKKQKKKALGTLWIAGKVNGRDRVLRGDHNWNFKNRVNRLLRTWKAPKDVLSNIMNSHFELRLPLDKYDKANTRKANNVTAKAFCETLRNFRKFKNERHIAGFLEGQMLMNSPYGLSFPSIIASGSNATILHYMKNDDDFSKDEMVLLDFGVRWMSMHADISRTVPASGKFNPLQKLLYEAVLQAQLNVETKAKVGVTIKELNEVCWGTINKWLDNDFKVLGGSYKLKYKKQPHGVSHLMGEQEHDGDPFRMYSTKPMQEGWLISNEPGLYGSFKLKWKGRTYDQEIGIRIEDNIMIEKKGSKNLSSTPKKIADIERLMAKNF